MPNLLSAQDEIIAKLKLKMPQYEKNILPLLKDEDVKKNCQFSPAIFVSYGGLNPTQETANRNNAAVIGGLWIVLIVFRDARGTNFANNEAGAIMYDVIQALQGFRPTDSKITGMALSSTPRHYNIGNAAIYPLVFSNTLIINGDS